MYAAAKTQHRHRRTGCGSASAESQCLPRKSATMAWQKTTCVTHRDRIGEAARVHPVILCLWLVSRPSVYPKSSWRSPRRAASRWPTWWRTTQNDMDCGSEVLPIRGILRCGCAGILSGFRTQRLAVNSAAEIIQPSSTALGTAKNSARTTYVIRAFVMR